MAVRGARAVAALAASVGLLLAGAGGAAADSPPPQWENVRVLDCGGTTVEAAFTPGGVFTSFHVIGSSDVIVPKRVQVIFPGQTEPVTTLDVPGFAKNARDTVVCTYTDPAGLAITVVGLRS